MFSIIDRALENAERMIQMTQLDMLVMDPYFSDHSSLSTQTEEFPKKAKPFKFFNHIADHDDFQSIVYEGNMRKTKEGEEFHQNLAYHRVPGYKCKG